MAQGQPAPLDVFRVCRTRGPLSGPSACGTLNAGSCSTTEWLRGLGQVAEAVGASIFLTCEMGW